MSLVHSALSILHNQTMRRTTGISTVGDLRRAIADGRAPRRSVHQEVRENLITSFAPASRSSPASSATTRPWCRSSSTRCSRSTTSSCSACAARRRPACCARSSTLLDEVIPVMPGCEINDDPLDADLRRLPRAARRARATRRRSRGSARDARYVEKLATPDVTIADMVGDIDPIKAARAGLQLSSELTMHYGLLPRANRGIFAINELPDLAGKIQVGLFNILQEGDVQIKGYPVRLPLDVMMAFTANPEDYTARGKIITPLKDRIGSEIRTHYPAGRTDAMAITAQEAWTDAQRRGPRAEVPAFVPRSSRRSRSRRARIAASTSAPASASACRSRRWRTSSRTPSGAR